MEPGVLTALMKSFSFTFSSGGARIVPDALLLLGLIAIVELALIGLWWAWGTERDLTGLVVKIIAIGFVAVLIKQWHLLTHLLVDGFIQIGLKAGGDVISLTDFTDPGNIAAYGFSVTGALFGRLMGYTGWDAMKNLPEIILGAPVSLLIILAYFGLAIWIFVTLIDFYAHAAITTILLPFAINAKVAFVAEKAIAAIFASGVRLLVLSFITAARCRSWSRSSRGSTPPSSPCWASSSAPSRSVSWPGGPTRVPRGSCMGRRTSRLPMWRGLRPRHLRTSRTWAR